LSTAVATVRVHPGKYEKDFNAERAPTLSVKVASGGGTRPAKWQKTNSSHGTFKGKIELKKYTKQKYDFMLTVQHQQLYEL